MPQRTTRIALRVALAAALAALAVACGGDSGSPIQPSPATPSVTGVTPNSGTTLGGTSITVTGANFAAGVAVAVGGAAATNVVVGSPTSLTATTAQRSAGNVEVTVMLNGRSGSLPGAFTYVAPQQINNQAPVIQSVTARGTRANEPAGFADLNEEVDVAAIVTDAETTADRLVYEWSATDGAFSGSGPAVKWRAPASGATPFVANLKLVVVDRFQTTDGNGLPIAFEHRVERTFTVKVHDSIKEVGGMATLFLENFSKSSVSVDEVMKDFLVGCYGTADERQQVADNRKNFTITSYSIGPPRVTVNFGGFCPSGLKAGDACSVSDVRWDSTRTDDGSRESVSGTDQVAAVYRDSRWWLCDSKFDGTATLGSSFLQLLTRERR